MKSNGLHKRTTRSSDLNYYVGSTGDSESVRTGSISKNILILMLFFFISLLGLAGVGVYHVTRMGYYTYYSLREQHTKNILCKSSETLYDEVSILEESVDTLFVLEDTYRALQGLTPINPDIRLAGIGGQPAVSIMAVQMLASPNLQKLSTLYGTLGNLDRQVTNMSTTLHDAYDKALVKEYYFSEVPSIWPTTGRITSPFGTRFHPILGRMKMHHGLDIGNKEWTPIIAPANGVCVFTGRRGDYGTAIVMKHPTSGYETRYAHLNGTAIEKGQTVKRGTIIGYMGNTGRSTGPHLHYEVRKNGTPLNPAKFLPDSTQIVE